jgi:hypothetical protein
MRRNPEWKKILNIEETKSKRSRKSTASQLGARTNRKPSSQRHANVRKEMKVWLDALVRIYKETDPAFGEASEERKLELARQAIELWWYLYRHLMVWAQSQIVGYEWARKNPEDLAKIAKVLQIKQVHEDSHLLEYIGLVHVYNVVNESDPSYKKVVKTIEKLEWELDDTALRNVIRELLVSRSTESSFWRFPLETALVALNLGEVQPIVRPTPMKKQGSAISLLRWKTLALSHVYFQIGKGIKKYVALDAVANSLGQSTETLRSWEKSLLADIDRADNLYSSRAAGFYLAELEEVETGKIIGRKRKNLEQEIVEQRFRNMSLFYRARTRFEELKRNPLDQGPCGTLGEPQAGKNGTQRRSSSTKKAVSETQRRNTAQFHLQADSIRTRQTNRACSGELDGKEESHRRSAGASGRELSGACGLNLKQAPLYRRRSSLSQARASRPL